MDYAEEVRKRIIKEKKMYGPRSEIFGVLEGGTLFKYIKNISAV